MANVAFHKIFYLSEKYFRVYNDFCFNYFESFWHHGNLVVRIIYYESVRQMQIVIGSETTLPFTLFLKKVSGYFAMRLAQFWIIYKPEYLIDVTGLGNWLNLGLPKLIIRQIWIARFIEF